MKRISLSEQILNAIAESKIPMTRISEASGLSMNTLTDIIDHVESNSLYRVQRILKAVGYQLEVTKILKEQV